MEERRRFKRFNISLKSVLTFSDDDSSGLNAEVRDFSREGVRVQIPQSLTCDAETPVKIQAYLPGEHLPIIFGAKTKWIRCNNNVCEIGCHLEAITAQDRNQILDYAYNRWRETVLA